MALLIPAASLPIKLVGFSIIPTVVSADGIGAIAIPKTFIITLITLRTIITIFIIINAKNNVFWAKRSNEHAWQFPQGGIKKGETLKTARFRELREETGLESAHVKIIGRHGQILDVMEKCLENVCKHAISHAYF